MSLCQTIKIQKLLNDIRNYLDITWDDPLGDEKLRGMVKRGMAAISGKIGECNFQEDTQEKHSFSICHVCQIWGNTAVLGKLQKMRLFVCR